MDFPLLEDGSVIFRRIMSNVAWNVISTVVEAESILEFWNLRKINLEFADNADFYTKIPFCEYIFIRNENDSDSWFVK